MSLKEERIIEFLRNCPICGKIPKAEVQTHYQKHLTDPSELGTAELYSSDGTASIWVETNGGISLILVRSNDETLSFETDFRLMKEFCEKILTLRR